MTTTFSGTVHGLVENYVELLRTVETRRQCLSGAAKRRRKRQRIESEVKRRRTLEELGWSVESGKGEDENVDEPVHASVSGSSESE